MYGEENVNNMAVVKVSVLITVVEHVSVLGFGWVGFFVCFVYFFVVLFLLLKYTFWSHLLQERGIWEEERGHMIQKV